MPLEFIPRRVERDGRLDLIRLSELVQDEALDGLDAFDAAIAVPKLDALEARSIL